MARALDQVEVRLGPRFVQRPGIARRAWHVITAMDDRAGNAAEPPGVAQQLAILQPCVVHEEMVLDPREGEREMAVAERLGQSRIGQQRDRLALPQRPRLRRLQLLRLVLAGQQAAIGAEHIVALLRRDRRDERFKFVGEHLGHAELIIPSEFRARGGIDPAQDQRADAAWMRLGIGERERRSPRSAEDEPAFHPDHLPQPLDIRHEMPGRIRL